MNPLEAQAYMLSLVEEKFLRDKDPPEGETEGQLDRRSGGGNGGQNQ